MGSEAHLQWIWGNTAARPVNEWRAGRGRSSTGLWYTLCNFYPVGRLLWFLSNQMETGIQGFADPKLIPVRFLCRKLSALDEQTIWSRAQNKGKNKHKCSFTRERQEKKTFSLQTQHVRAGAKMTQLIKATVISAWDPGSLPSTHAGLYNHLSLGLQRFCVPIPWAQPSQ